MSLSGVFKYHWHALLTANLTILPGPLISLSRPKCLNTEWSSTGEHLYHFHVDYSNEKIDYNIFIGPESDHCLPLSVTNSLTHSCLVNFIDVTLACADGNSKLVEVVTVVDVDEEDRVGNSLLQIWEVRFSHKAKLLFRLWAQGLVKIPKLKFSRDTDVLLRFWMLNWDSKTEIRFELVIWTQPLGSVVPLAMF